MSQWQISTWIINNKYGRFQLKAYKNTTTGTIRRDFQSLSRPEIFVKNWQDSFDEYMIQWLHALHKRNKKEQE